MITRNQLARAIHELIPSLTMSSCVHAARIAESDATMEWANDNDIPIDEVVSRIILYQGLKPVDKIFNYGKEMKPDERRKRT